METKGSNGASPLGPAASNGNGPLHHVKQEHTSSPVLEAVSTVVEEVETVEAEEGPVAVNEAPTSHDYAAPVRGIPLTITRARAPPPQHHGPTRVVSSSLANPSSLGNGSGGQPHRVYVMKGPLPPGGLQGRIMISSGGPRATGGADAPVIKTLRLEPSHGHPMVQQAAAAVGPGGKSVHTLTVQNVAKAPPATMTELAVCEVCSLCFPNEAQLGEHQRTAHPDHFVQAAPPQQPAQPHAQPHALQLKTEPGTEVAEEAGDDDEIDVVEGGPAPPPVLSNDQGQRIKVVRISRGEAGGGGAGTRGKRKASPEDDDDMSAAADVLLSLSKGPAGKKNTPFSPQGSGKGGRIKQVIHLDVPKFETVRPWLKRDLPDPRVSAQGKRRSGQKLFAPPSTGASARPQPTSESGPGMPVFCCSACKSGCRSKGQIKDTGGLPVEELASADPDIQEEYRYKCELGHALVFKHLLSWRAHVAEAHADALAADWAQKKCALCEELQYDESMLSWHLGAVHEIEEEAKAPTYHQAPQASSSAARRSGSLGARRGVRPLHRKNAATTKLPGSGAGAEAPPLEEMSPAFLEQIQTVDQRRHFRQAHAERLMQQLLLSVSEKLDAAEAGMDGSEILVLLETFQDYWRIFHPATFEEVMEKLSRIELDDSGMELPPLSTRIADSYTKTRGVYETIHEAVELGQWILEAKKRKPRINFACRKFPGSDQDAPPLHQLSAGNISQLGYDQIRRFRRAQSEVFLYELLRFIPNLTQVQQKVLLASLWRYWWVFYPDELHLKEEAEAAVIATQGEGAGLAEEADAAAAALAAAPTDGLDVVG